MRETLREAPEKKQYKLSAVKVANLPPAHLPPRRIVCIAVPASARNARALMGAALPKPVCTTVLERHGSKDFKIGLAEMNGWRTSMEDAHVVHLGNGEGYFGILDGHGGAECSAWCAAALHEKLAAQGCPPNDAAAKKLVLDTDAAYLATGQSSGSTAATSSRKPRRRRRSSRSAW